MPKESVIEFVAELQWLAVHCEPGAYLSEALHDSLVCDLRNEVVQWLLLSKVDLTLTKAIELALSSEAAEKNAQQLKGSDQLCVGEVAQASGSVKACYHCGSHKERLRLLQSTA